MFRSDTDKNLALIYAGRQLSLTYLSRPTIPTIINFVSSQYLTAPEPADWIILQTLQLKPTRDLVNLFDCAQIFIKLYFRVHKAKKRIAFILSLFCIFPSWRYIIILFRLSCDSGTTVPAQCAIVFVR